VQLSCCDKHASNSFYVAQYPVVVPFSPPPPSQVNRLLHRRIYSTVLYHCICACTAGHSFLVIVPSSSPSFFFASVVSPSSFLGSSNAANISHCHTHVLQFPLLLSKALTDHILQFPLLLSCPAIALALHFIFFTRSSCSRCPLSSSSGVISSPL